MSLRGFPVNVLRTMYRPIVFVGVMLIISSLMFLQFHKALGKSREHRVLSEQWQPDILSKDRESDIQVVKMRETGIAAQNQEVEREGSKEKCVGGFHFLENLVHDLQKKQTGTRLYLPVRIPVRLSGTLVNTGNNQCMDRMDGLEGDIPHTIACHGLGRNQGVTLTADGRMKIGRKFGLCIGITDQDKKIEVVLKVCQPEDETQKWQLISEHGLLQSHALPEYCISAGVSKNTEIVMKRCDRKSTFQVWSFVSNDSVRLRKQP